MKNLFKIIRITVVCVSVCLIVMALPIKARSQEQENQSAPPSQPPQTESQTEPVTTESPKAKSLSEPAAMAPMAATASTESEQPISVPSANVTPSLYTGVANINVPLYTIQTGNITLPISLNYQTSGIKVRDVETEVGLGWNLSAGGSITRVVKGAADYAHIYIKRVPIFEYTGEAIDCYEVADTTIRADEPDLYYFNFGGRSGMFVVEKMNKVYTIPHSGLKIDLVLDRPSDLIFSNGYGPTTDYDSYCGYESPYHFEIIDEQGNLYTYTSNKWNSTLGSNYKNVTEWSLSLISDMNGNKIRLEYSDYFPSIQEYSYRGNIEFVNSAPTPTKITDENIGMVSKPSKSLLRLISWDGGIINFKTSKASGSCTDLSKLDDIEICSKDNNVVKTYSLEYSNFLPSRHLKLDRIYLINKNEKLLVNAFKYKDDGYFPSRDSKSFDHWGYYNGASNATSLPDISINGYSYFRKGADKTPRLEYTKTGTLEKITNSYGGSITLEFELNSTKAETYGGLRICGIVENYGTTNSRRKFEYIDTESKSSSGVSYTTSKIYSLDEYVSPALINYKPANIFNYVCFDTPSNKLFDLTGTPVCYSEVKETYPNGSFVITKFTNHNNYPDESSKEVLFVQDGVLYRQRSDGFHIPNTSMAFKRGLPYEVSYYNSAGQTMGRQSTEYCFDNSRQQKINSETFYKDGVNASITKTGSYSWYSMPVYPKTVTNQSTDLTLPSSTTYWYNTDDMVVVRSFSIDNQGNNYSTDYRYPSYYEREFDAEWSHDSALIAIHLLDSLNVKIPIEVASFKNNRLISADLKLFVTNTVNWSEIPVLKSINKLAINEKVQDDFCESFCANRWNKTQFLYYDTNYKTTQVVDYYNSKGVPVVVHNAAGEYISSIYGYDNTMLVATVKGGRGYPWGQSTPLINEIYHTSFEDADTFKGTQVTTAKSGDRVLNSAVNIPLKNYKYGEYVINYWESTDSGKSWKKVSSTININSSAYNLTLNASPTRYIDEVRIFPKGARMSTQTFTLGVGKTSETDINGVTTYYEYDGFGRLIMVLDNDRNVLKSYIYNF